MKHFIFSTISIVISFLTIHAQSDDVCGLWLTDKSDSQIQIYKAANGKYYGKIAWMDKDRDKLDVENPNDKLKSRKVFGIQIMNNVYYNSKSKTWEGGTIYDPESGKTYDCFLWFEKDRNLLMLKGYVLGMKFLGRETQWKREPKLRP